MIPGGSEPTYKRWRHDVWKSDCYQGPQQV